MSSKYAVLLFIFFFNLVATTLADASHIELEMHNSAAEHSHSHDEDEINRKIAGNADQSEKQSEHCNEHEGCHNSHFHHYIVTADNTFVSASYIKTAIFINKDSSYIPHFLDIIKPPLV